MNDFESNYRESTIVSVPRVRWGARDEEPVESERVSNFGSDLVTLSGDQPSPNDEQKAAWLRANRNRSAIVDASQTFTFRPPTMVFPIGRSSAACLQALSTAARRFA